MDSIRSKYEKYGVDTFYENYFEEHENPHEPIIHKSIEVAEKLWEVDFSKALDLACGTGEITKILLKLGYENIDAVDAYSHKYYERNIKRKCETLTFDDIIKGKLDDRHYSIVICSFAMHLLEKSKLPIFLYKLSQISDQLLIISPHKRPIVKDEWGWLIKNEMSLDKVRTRLFTNFYRIKE